MMICNKTCTDSDRFLGRVLAGLMIGVIVVAGSLAHAVGGIQAFV
jgi:hypothetical protein